MLVQAANYSYIRADFTVLRRHLAQAGAVGITNKVIFAYAANPPKPATAGGTALPAGQRGHPSGYHRGTVTKTAIPRR